MELLRPTPPDERDKLTNLHLEVEILQLPGSLPAEEVRGLMLALLLAPLALADKVL